MATAEVELARRQFTVEEYDRMVEAGILGRTNRVELIEGEVVQMSPIGRRHAAWVGNLTGLLAGLAGTRAVLWVQNPLPLAPRSKPQPDLALLRPRSYAATDPAPDDVLLVIAVADSTLRYDREVKVPLYARAGVPEVWLIDGRSRTVEVHRDPGSDGYREQRRIPSSGTISPLAFPDLVVPVASIFA